MKPTVIKDIQNRIIGTTQVQGTITRLNDRLNRTYATYNSKTNTTVSGGKAIGFGNQLLRTLR